MLGLIDAALVASLVVMVIISGYENFVSRFEDGGEIHWLGTIDVGSLKVKVASTIVAISSIHLLQIFLNAVSYTAEQLMWLTIMHLAFVVSALMLAYIDRRHGAEQSRQDEAPAERGRILTGSGRRVLSAGRSPRCSVSLEHLVGHEEVAGQAGRLGARRIAAEIAHALRPAAPPRR